MTRPLFRRFAPLAALAAFALLAGTASAADVKITCEKRSARSKVSVDGNNLPAGAMYYAVVTSGANQAQSAMAAAVGDEAEFDFDSNANDVAQGATPIAVNFVVGGRVSAQVLDAAGKVVASGTASCRVRR